MDKTRLVEYDRPAYITGLPHRVRQPERIGPHPTIVMLHGRHGTEDVTWVFRQTLPEHCLVIAPRAIELEPEKPESDIPGYSWMIQDGPGWPTLEGFQDASQALADFIRALPDAYRADPDQIYVLGFSQGAAAAYATAINNPGLIRGIAGLVGFAPRVSPAVLETRPLQDLPIFMAIGRRDNLVPLEVAHECRDTLLAAGAALDCREYHTGHKLNSSGRDDLTNWWAEHCAEVSR